MRSSASRIRVVSIAVATLFLAAWIASLVHHHRLAPAESAAEPNAATVAIPAAGTPSPGTAVPHALPPLRRDGELWRATAAEPAFAAFAAWAERYQSAAPAERAVTETEGVALARARLTALANLIQTNPERALQLAVPADLRQSFPASIQSALEERINSRGDLDVICVLPMPGQEVTPIVRAARSGKETLRVFTFGAGLEYVTRRDVPLHGISVPLSAATAAPSDPAGVGATRLMALDPQPARLLEATELGALAQAGSTPVCVATGQPWDAQGTPTAIEYGGAVKPFVSLAAATDWVAAAVSGEDLDQPAPPANLPMAESSYTEGRKRFLLMRVDFPDYQNDVFPTNTALQHMRDMSNFLAQISYFKHIIAPVGQGSDITPIMRMSGNAATYNNAGLSTLYPEARAAARDVHGYDLDNYDFFFVCTGGQPSYSYAGLGYVGGVGYHLANGYFDVRTSAHEFGHNLGLSHANWWDTGGASTIGAGSNEEYGDPFDTMGGSGGGSRHFSASFKNRLGWIPNGDAITVTTSGVFRVYAHDNATAPGGLRALRLNRASGDPYWIEFRQLWTGNRALMNGLNFRWAGGASQLLDMNPGSAAGKDDHSLTIGRTFSEPNRNFHVTPIGKGHTFPESMDVVIQFGPFPTNKLPTVAVTASTTTASIGQTITFAATAADPNGDALAYYWDFGGASYSVDNSAVTTQSFATAGDYHVECTVSDMKGGTAREGIVVRVGSPTTFSISGRALDTNGLPVSGIRVSVDSSHYAFTESDGTYAITRLNAGSHTVTAQEPVSDALSFANPFFANPVTVGPNFTTADFITLAGNQVVLTPIVSRGATWKYFDKGIDQGTAWRETAFDDSGWSNGAAILGYGQGNEVTDVSYGPDAANKYPTTYFRRAFTVTDPGAYTNLQLEVLRDDGPVVYLNGTEIFRDNMPAGAPTYATLAEDALEPDAYLVANFSPSLLVPGNNVFAVEMHQAAPDSSDLNFDLSLSGLATATAANLNLVYLASPASGQVFVGPTSVTLTAVAQSGVASPTNVEFRADGALVGQDTTAPFASVWSGASLGTHTLWVVAAFGDGRRLTSAPVNITLISPPIPAVSLSLVPTGSVWRYLAGPTNAPTGWTNAAFNDLSWVAAGAQLGYGDGDETSLVPYGGVSNNRWVTTYFRHQFAVADPGAITNLTLRLKRDDGAVVYLNGVEVVRDLLPLGAIAWGTLATNAADDGANFWGFTLDPARLAVGTNQLAVEIHQSALNSSDLSFDLALDALATTNRPSGVWLTSPTNGATFALPGSILLSAQAVVGGSLGLTRIEFFGNEVKIGEANTAPYTLAWQNPPDGVQQIVAVATDTAGGSVTSAPVTIHISAPPTGSQLVSWGDWWKYSDDGVLPGTNWMSRTFDDRAWKSGGARLGYGGDGELTTVSFGPDPTARHVTTWFRKTFTVTNPSSISNLLLRIVRDDGVVVYLNGVEVHRNNLQPGPVSWNSLALAAIGGADETTPVTALLGRTNLLAGTNIIAVEAHQAAVDSSDLGFDLELIAQTEVPFGQIVYLTAPAGNARFNAGANVALTSYTDPAAGVTQVEFFADGTKVGQDLTAPFNATWVGAPLGTWTLTAVATHSGGLRATSAPVNITVGTPPPPVLPVTETLIAGGSVWSYWDNVAPVAPGWQWSDFDDSAWPSAPARFGWGLDGESTTITEGRVTHYFRQWFTVADPALLTELAFRIQRDDGAVVYVNGREIFRSNMPGGAITASTLASTAANTPDETTWYEYSLATSGSGLIAGSNLIAVELHQSSATSSDGGFDLQLQGYGTTEPRVYLSNPRLNAAYFIPAEIELDAQVNATAGSSVTRVEFFANSTKIGEGTSAPWHFLWSNPAIGRYAITAVATDDSGRTMTSEPVPISVGLQTVSLPLIPTGAVWKYLDNGSNQGTNWAQRSYNDSAWFSGPGELGYGDTSDGRPEATIVGSGPASSRYITTYFRHQFVVPPNVVITNLEYHLVFDDGAVVWLNGAEQYRSNLPPAGVIAYNTTATTSISGAAEATYFTTIRPTTSVASGTNLVAVEIHQQSGTSSDISFDLELIGRGYIDIPPVPELLVEQDGLFIRLSWPANATGYTLESTDALPPAGTWQPYNATISESGGRKSVTVTTSLGEQYFRLARP